MNIWRDKLEMLINVLITFIMWFRKLFKKIKDTIMGILVSKGYVNSNYTLRSGGTASTDTSIMADKDWITTNYWCSVSGESTGNRCPDSDELAPITPYYSYMVNIHQVGGCQLMYENISVRCANPKTVGKYYACYSDGYTHYISSAGGVGNSEVNYDNTAYNTCAEVPA